MENSTERVSEEKGLKSRSIWRIHISNPMSPDYDEDVYCETRDTVDAHLGNRFATGLSDFVFDDLTSTYVARRPINGFELHVNLHPLWRLG